MTELRKIWNGLTEEGKRNYCAAWHGALSRYGEVTVSRERFWLMWRAYVGDDDDPEEVAALLDEVCGTCEISEDELARWTAKLEEQTERWRRQRRGENEP